MLKNLKRKKKNLEKKLKKAEKKLVEKDILIDELKHNHDKQQKDMEENRRRDMEMMLEKNKVYIENKLREQEERIINEI